MRKAVIIKRDRAVLSGLDFLYRTACDADNFGLYGFDYLYSFHTISSTSRDAGLRRVARKMGLECARRWRREHATLPEGADADLIAQMVFGGLSADRLGVRDKGFKAQVLGAARRFGPRDYFWFDPATEPPPADVPEDCGCGAANARARVSCRKCKRPLTTMSRYEVWLVALIRSYLGERYGVMLGARYADVIKWLPAMRTGYDDGGGWTADFIWSIYAITHVVYTLNGYNSYNLSPRWLPDEYELLKRNLGKVIEKEDAEMVGEILDSLKSFGLADSHRLIRDATDYLLLRQNADGSWGDTNSDDIYARYHPTLTAINGLRDYRWSETRLCFPRLKPLLEQWAGNKGM